MKVKEKPKYNIWQNVCFSVKLAWQTRKRVLVITAASAILSVLLNLVQLYVAPEILSRVEQQAPLGLLLLTIGGFTAALFLLSGLEDYLDTVCQPGEIDVRTAIIQHLTRKTCETSYPNIRDPKVLKLKEQAGAAVGGNSDAGEHIWKTLTQLLTNLIGFVTYLILLTNLNGFLILVVIATSMIGFFATRYLICPVHETLLAYSFTLPATRPLWINFCSPMNTIIIGTEEITAAAENIVQWAAN